MRFSPLLTATLFFLLSCRGPVQHLPLKDSAVAAVAAVYPKPTKPNAAAHADTAKLYVPDDDNPEPSLGEIYKECIDRYTHPVIIDTVFRIGGAPYHLRLKHYCLMDSTIHLPKDYVTPFHLDSFVTHNFVSDLSLEKEGREILRRSFVKNDFDKFLYPEEKSYGVLLCPNLRLGGDSIQLGYSISIPLTDVGVGAYVTIDADGHVNRIYPRQRSRPAR